MRPRFFGISGSAILLLTIAVAAVYLGQSIDNRVVSPHKQTMAMLSEVPKSEPLDIQQLNQMVLELPRLVVPRQRDQIELDLSLFGYVPVKSNRDAGTLPYRSERLPDYPLSMTFISKKNRYCVIGGKFYRQGERLDDGARIVRIQQNKVQLSWHGKNFWIVVKNEKMSVEKP